MKQNFNIVFLGVIFLLVGCSAINKLDDSGEYKKASACGKPLVLPKDIDTKAIENHYPVPKAESDNPVGASILPPKSDLIE